jgi:tyrosyl-tRNA synthetase
MFRSPILKELEERGFLHQCTDADTLDEQFLNHRVTGYIGFDCTADSLHVGSLVQIMLLRKLQQFGHRPIALLGSGTTRIGDPSGKDESRQMLSLEQIGDNQAGIMECLKKFVFFEPFEHGLAALLVDNIDWLGDLKFLDVLRDVGPHFTINRMLTMDSVKNRLDREQPMTFLEFNYMILQSFDFLELNRKFGCTLQMGGSDQWGNITSGIDLTRRITGNQVFGLTTPLLTTSSGSKMGKTANGAVWLDATKTSVFDFWQFWRNTEDADVGRFLRLFTELPMRKIIELEMLKGSEINEAKKVLATEITTLVHGLDAARKAEEAATATFVQGIASDNLPKVGILTGGDESIPVIFLFVLAGLTSSKNETRRLIRSAGIKVDDMLVTDEDSVVTVERLKSGVKLSLGKKKHVIAIETKFGQTP